MRRWWLAIALLLSVGMNLGLFVAMALSRPEFLRTQEAVLRPGNPGQLWRLADRLGLKGEARERFLERNRRFWKETAGPRQRLPEIRKLVRAELIRDHPDPARLEALQREAADLFLTLERSLTETVLDSRAMLSPEEERRYIDLIAHLQIEGPGTLGRLPRPAWLQWLSSSPAPKTQPDKAPKPPSPAATPPAGQQQPPGQHPAGQPSSSPPPASR
ncbi:MAG TPA: periplasmic heavy metal sensor [Thermoanaerobaculia bacterium]|nr:periplasmic heavy metal sensor [Thermoanaerobaculia bacterium]